MFPFFLSLILSGCSFFYKKSKGLFALIVVFLWILFGFNYSNADYFMYNNLYNVPADQLVFLKFEGGFSFLMYCSKIIGLSFQQFLITISAIVLLLVYRFFYVFSKLPAFSIICFFWFIFPLQYVILRNFIAFAIVLQGFLSVLKKEDYNKLKFVFFVLLASTIHISSLFYFIFLLAFKENQFKIKNISLVVFCLLGLVSVSHQFIFNFLSLYSKDKAIFYTTDIRLFLGYSFLQISNLVIVYFVLKPEEDSLSKEDKRINNLILNINIIMLLIIVVYYELAVFVRMLLNISILNIIFITNSLFVGKPKIMLKMVYFSYLFLLFFIFIYLVKDTTILSLFNKNLLFK